MSNWVNEAVFYHIYPLGFCGAPPLNNEKVVVNRIKKVIDWIPHLKEIGVNAIYFSPIFESSEHGYDTIDYRVIDKRLGSNDDFKRVSEELHKNNIKVVLDGVFNHVGREFWAFKDIQQNGQNSKYCSWFNNINFSQRSPMGDNFSYEGWEGHFNLVKLNLKNPEVVNHIINAIDTWIDEFNIDGIRFDVAYCMDEDFFKEINKFCKNKKKDFWLMGEMIHGDYSRLLKPGMLDSVTNYECFKGIYSSHNDKNYFEIAYSLNRQFGDGGIYKGIYTYNFVDNHDVNRIGSTLTNKNHIYNVYTLLFTMPGIPSIYYGSEWAIEGEKSNGSDAGIRPCIELKDMNDESSLVKHIQRLSYARKSSEPLKYGSYEQILVRNEQFVYCRSLGEDKAYIVLNLSDRDEYLNFNVNKNEDLKDLLTGEIIKVNNCNVNIKISAFSGKILVAASSIKEETFVESLSEETQVEEKNEDKEEKNKEVEKEKTVLEKETTEAKIKILNDKLDSLQNLLNQLTKEIEEVKKQI